MSTPAPIPAAEPTPAADQPSLLDRINPPAKVRKVIYVVVGILVPALQVIEAAFPGSSVWTEPATGVLTLLTGGLAAKNV